MLQETFLKQTPLYDEHLRLNARIVPFAGWQMPVQYPEGIIVEYEQTRNAVTVFDTSHMGQFLIEGDAVKSGLDFIVTFKISDMPLKSCRYGAMLNDKGGIIDDLIVYRLEEKKWMIVVNAGNIDKDARHITAHITKEGNFKNICAITGKLDLQGPRSRDVLKEIAKGVEKLDYYTFDHFDILGEKTLVSRTGYTGELGYEIYFPREKISTLWQWFLEKGSVKPAGLGVRDVLRLEMGYSLYGQDLDETISPLEAGLNKFIDFEKDFAGREALLKEKQSGIKRKMIFFTSESRRSPRHNHKIYLPAGQEIGVVTSGTFSPAFKLGIGCGFVARDADLNGGKILFGDEKNKMAGELASRPFYKNGSLKK